MRQGNIFKMSVKGSQAARDIRKSSLVGSKSAMYRKLQTQTNSLALRKESFDQVLDKTLANIEHDVKLIEKQTSVKRPVTPVASVCPKDTRSLSVLLNGGRASPNPSVSSVQNGITKMEIRVHDLNRITKADVASKAGAARLVRRHSSKSAKTRGSPSIVRKGNKKNASSEHLPSERSDTPAEKDYLRPPDAFRPRSSTFGHPKELRQMKHERGQGDHLWNHGQETRIQMMRRKSLPHVMPNGQVHHHSKSDTPEVLPATGLSLQLSALRRNLEHRKPKSIPQLKASNKTSSMDNEDGDDSSSDEELFPADLHKCRYLRGVQTKELSVEEIFSKDDDD